MLNRFALRHWALSLLVALALAPAAFAQQQPPTDANVDIQKVQDWEVRCPQGDTSQGACTMTQLIDNPNSGQPLMRVVQAYPPQADGAVLVFLLPLGVRLAPGMQLSVDGGEPIPFPYQVCQQQGCRGDLPVKPELMRQLRGGSTATLSMIGPRGERMDLDISLMGFTDATQRIAP
ncbi:MAG: invasion associated locus B family protein [Pseudomonadota bacterium]|nr:invasion associated locus B family protein [Pseudomonadota bacterium]